MTTDINTERFLHEQGFDRSGAASQARAVLEAGGLTRAGKQAFAATKRDRAQRLLASALLRVCGDACLRIDRAGDAPAREAVRVSKDGCEVCGGSNDRRAVLACRQALRRRVVRRIVVVGGTGPQQRRLRDLLRDGGLAVRYVDGTKASHSAKDAVANTRWAQLIVIWGATPLRHAVSDLYTAEPPPHLRVVSVQRRGIEALCAEVVRSLT